MNSNCANLFHVFMPKTLYLINETHVGNTSYNSDNELNRLGPPPLHSPMNIKTQHVACKVTLILPTLSQRIQTINTLASLYVILAIQKTKLDPNYIFLEDASNEKLRFPLELFTLTSTFILFDKTRINIFCMSCGSKNNYISTRRDISQISLIDSLFRSPDFYGLPVYTNLKDIIYVNRYLKLPNDMIQMSVSFCTLHFLSNKLNFSTTLNKVNSQMILYSYLSDGVISTIYTPDLNKKTVPSNGIFTEEYHLTVFTLKTLNLYTVLLPFDDASWACLSTCILIIITSLIYYRLNYNSTQLVILWTIRNIFEQDDDNITKQVCGSKPTMKYVVILWSLCSMVIGWWYKGYVSSEISIQFPSSIPNSLQEILSTNMTIITITSSPIDYGDTGRSLLHEKISQLLNMKHNLDYSQEYFQFLSSLSHKVQYVDSVLDQYLCSNTPELTQLTNNSNAVNSWSTFSFKEDVDFLTALIDTCSNFTSIKITSNSNKFPVINVWAGFSNIFFKIFSNKLSVVTQSGLYEYWNKEYTKKLQVVKWKKFIRKMNNFPNVLLKAKHVLRKFIADINGYQQVYKCNPITLSSLDMSFVACGALCFSCTICLIIEISKVYFLKFNIKLFKMKFIYQVKVLQVFIRVRLKKLWQWGFRRKIWTTKVTAF